MTLTRDATINQLRIPNISLLGDFQNIVIE
jgi:hypothetical protein